jgi:hypothetical protein
LQTGIREPRLVARTSNRRRHAYSNIKRKEGKRSGLEVQVASQLEAAGVKAEYEKHRIAYRQIRDKHYTPDFKLPNGIYVEAKGWFKSADRSKHLAIKYQYPDLDIRFVFSNSKSKIGKKSATTYAMWCEKNGFKYADKVVPQEWINEPMK